MDQQKQITIELWIELLGSMIVGIVFILYLYYFIRFFCLVIEL